MKNYNNCIDCPHHKVIADSDPFDWFADDDSAVVCMLTPRAAKKSKHAADRQGFRPITVACRPYRVRKESKTPDWCPLNK